IRRLRITRIFGAARPHHAGLGFGRTEHHPGIGTIAWHWHDGIAHRRWLLVGIRRVLWARRGGDARLAQRKSGLAHLPQLAHDGHGARALCSLAVWHADFRATRRVELIWPVA